jgi:DNA-binding winged helix-turn-helix (wHTH) protein
MIDYRILGPLEVSADGRVIDVGGPKQRALLAILLLRANEPVPRDVLVHELWGERPPPGARGSLEVYVSRLRKALGAAGNGHVVATRPGGYCLQLAHGQLDVDRFERLVAEGRSALAGNAPEQADASLRAAPTTTVPSVGAVCPGGPCPASQAAGGGIDNWGALTLTDSVVSGNQAAGELTGQADGGGIADESSARLTLIRSSVTGNTASAAPNGRFADGGGIYVDHDGTLTVQHSVIDGNTASLTSRYPASVGDSHAGTGGVDVQSGGTATIGHTSISGNRVSVTDPKGAPVGFDPGICACDSAATITLTDSKVNGNRLVVNVKTSAEGGSGGALEADGNAVITRTEVRGNTVMVTSDTGVAAAVAVVNNIDGTGRAVMRDSIISGNHVTATSRSGVAIVRGAGLANNGPLLLSHVTISGNSATASAPHGWGRGGGVFNGLVFPTPSPSLVVHGGTISHNILRVRHGAIASGGGIYSKGFPAQAAKGVVTANTPDDCVGCS